MSSSPTRSTESAAASPGETWAVPAEAAHTITHATEASSRAACAPRTRSLCRMPCMRSVKLGDLFGFREQRERPLELDIVGAHDEIPTFVAPDIAGDLGLHPRAHELPVRVELLLVDRDPFFLPQGEEVVEHLIAHGELLVELLQVVPVERAQLL